MTSNTKGGTVETPRTPAGREKGQTPPYLEVIRLISDFEEKRINDKEANTETRRELTEAILDYLTEEVGVHATLLQFGLLKENGEDILKNYFYAGMESLDVGDPIEYEELPEQPYMIFEALVKKKVDGD